MLGTMRAKIAWKIFEGQWQETSHARLLLLQSQDEDGSEAMNGRSCHVCLCQLDCLALDCGLTLAIEVAARKHDVVLYKISRWLTCSKVSSRRISRHNWWPSWCQSHSSSLLRADRNPWNLTAASSCSKRRSCSSCLDGLCCSAFYEIWFWWAPKLWCNLFGQRIMLKGEPSISASHCKAIVTLDCNKFCGRIGREAGDRRGRSWRLADTCRRNGSQRTSTFDSENTPSQRLSFVFLCRSCIQRAPVHWKRASDHDIPMKQYSSPCWKDVAPIPLSHLVVPGTQTEKSVRWAHVFIMWKDPDLFRRQTSSLDRLPSRGVCFECLDVECSSYFLDVELSKPLQ